MPYSWVELEVFYDLGDLQIYHVYKEDLSEAGVDRDLIQACPECNDNPPEESPASR